MDRKQLFQFLKEFNRLKIKPLLDIKSYEETLWLSEIPKEAECDSIIQHISSDKLKFSEWLKLKKPSRKPYPEPPEKIRLWINDKGLKDYKTPPELFPYILEDNSHKVFLKDRPQVKKIFEDYLDQKWRPWAEEEARLQPILNIYHKLYTIYSKIKDQAEDYQAVLALGFLSSKDKKGKDIKRHIVTSPLSLDFNSSSGSITVGPPLPQVELSLETDFLEESVKPSNSENLDSRLADLGDDFWKNEAFYSTLKSWINVYDPRGQFYSNFKRPEQRAENLAADFPSLSISPAIILRKRQQRAFIKFYSSAIKNFETKDQTANLNSIEANKLSKNQIKDPTGHPTAKVSLQGKYYLPLPLNEEQLKVMKQISLNHQVVVKGPPGTGKTHSIASLICHFLSQGKKILITSQTDRALKVLKSKLPHRLQPLCVEILGKDPSAFQKLQDSFSKIYHEHQYYSQKDSDEKIKKLEKKDDQLKGELESIKSRLLAIQSSERVEYTKKFSSYSGTLAKIADKLKSEESQHQWIKDFDFDDISPTISNDEALSFLDIAENLKGIKDTVLKESVEFLSQVFIPEQLETKLQEMKKASDRIDRHSDFKSIAKESIFLKLKEDDFNQIHQLIIDLIFKLESLLNRKEQWMEKSLEDCLLSKVTEWRFLYDSTVKLLNENKEAFSSVEKIKIKISQEILPKEVLSDPKLVDSYLSDLLRDFSKEAESNDINWGFFAAKTVRSLKKIKINGKPISAEEDVQKLKNYVQAKKSSSELNHLWKNQDIEINTDAKDFSKNYSLFMRFCKLLEECLFVHSQTEKIKALLNPYNIPYPYWKEMEKIQEQKNIMALIQSQREMKKVDEGLEEKISYLKKYETQENQIARKLISALQARDYKNYKSVFKQADTFKERQKEFQKFCQIADRFKNKKFVEQIRQNTDKLLWGTRLKAFTQALNWQKADRWHKEQSSESFLKQLHQTKEKLLENIQDNMKELVAQKTWASCLSHITDGELKALDGFVKSIRKIGKGTGKTANKHRRMAKKRMEECRSSIPAWIMPLYRVVESLAPPSPQHKAFDIVIIDEASQTGPDGLLLDSLAEKMIVVGDEEQISPENPGVRDEDVEILKKKYLSNMDSDYIGREYSYYDYCSNKFAGSRIQLREHFRCMPEIIKFSNDISYSGTPLIPLRQYGSSRLAPLKTTYVEKAVSKVGGGKFPQNAKEAEEISETIKQCLADPQYRDKTFGVIVLQGKAQIQLIESALASIDKTEMENRDIRVGNPYDFQGDERDVIFLSLAIAKDWHKKALTRELYKKQYNVAVSRAKDQLWLFHSVESSDLSPNDLRRKLLDHCKTDPKTMTVWEQSRLQKLYTKIKETPNKGPGNAPDPFDSWFEARVFYKIAMKGFHVIPQYKKSGYRMDMLIIGQKNMLAVECDGDYWHGSEEQQRQDMERQWNLETCGWTFWRLRESLFRREEEEALKPLWELLDRMKIEQLGQQEQRQEQGPYKAKGGLTGLTRGGLTGLSSLLENELMTDKEVQDLISTKEGYRIEFKQALDKSLIREVSAFANSGGGCILLGVADDGSIKGIGIDNRFLSKVQDVLNSLQPKLNIELEIKTLKGKKLLILHVPEGHQKPYKCPSGFYMRIGANSQKLSRDEIIDFFNRELPKKLWEELINEKADFKRDFYSPSLSPAFEHFLKLSGISPKQIKSQALLQNLNCLTQDKKMTNLGVLFFAQSIDFIMNYALVDCILFQGTARVKILDRKRYTGPLLDNIESAIAFIQRHTNTEYVITGRPKREEIPDYPEPALREAVINAVCHRDYFDRRCHVVVEVSSDSVKILNQGGLPPGLDAKNFGTQSAPRNPLIADMLQRVNYIEKAGTGIARIKEALRKHEEQWKRRIELDIQYDSHSYSISFKKLPSK